MTRRQEQELQRKRASEAASLLVQQFGLGRYSQKKHPRDRRPARRAVNPVLTDAAEAPAKRFVYVIGHPGEPVKIGIAADVAARLAGVQTGYPRKLTVFFHVAADDAAKVESACHRALAEHRTHGEWFDVAPDVAIDTIRRALAA